MRKALADKHRETLIILESLQARVLDDELIRWKREQQLAGNGVPFQNNLDSIQVISSQLYYRIHIFHYSMRRQSSSLSFAVVCQIGRAHV